MEREPKSRQGVLVPLMSFMPTACVRESGTAALNSEYNLCFALAEKLCGECMCVYLHVC